MRRPLMIVSLLCLVACSPVKVQRVKQYTINRASSASLSQKPTRLTLYVGRTKANEAYQENDMLYVVKPFELNSFAKNEWIAPPAKMINDVLVKSLENSHVFHAITTAPYSGHSHCRVNTRLTALEQNFLSQPSEIVLSIKADVINEKTDNIIASHRFHRRERALTDTPYGGVLATNLAIKKIMTNLVKFVATACRKAAH